MSRSSRRRLARARQTCARKEPIKTEIAADDIAARHDTRGCYRCTEHSLVVYSYKCDVCPWWHVGHRDWTNTTRGN